MPRNITVTFADGSSHVYQNAPDNVTPDQVLVRAAKEFGKPVKALDGGRGAKPAAAKAPTAPAPKQYRNFDPGTALRTYNTARDSLLKNMSGKSPQERQRALARFDTDPRIQGIRKAAGLAEVRSRQEEVKDAGRRAARTGAPGFLTAAKAGLTRGMFGIPERLGAALVDAPGLSYDEKLAAVRAKTDAEMEQSGLSNFTGQLAGGILGGGAAAKLVGGAGGLLTRAGAPRAGNVLQGLTQVRKGERLKNAGKLLLAGTAGGAAQAAGEGSDVATGALYGAGGTAAFGAGAKVLGTGRRLTRSAMRPFSKNVGKAMREIISEDPVAVAARQQGLSSQVGENVPLVAALKEADFREVADQVVRRSPEAEEAAKAHTGKYVRSFMDRMLRHVNKAGREANDGGAQITTIGELAQLRKNTADDLMKPIGGITLDFTQLSLDDLERQVTREIGGRIKDLAPRVNEALRDLAPDDLKDLGLDASDLAAARKLMTDWGLGKPVVVTVREMDALRRSLDAAGKASMTSNPANSMAYRNAARSIREFVEQEVPAYGQMVDTYAAQSRMMEGFDTAAKGKRISDIEDDLLRNNLQTPEGRIGMKAGELFRQREAVTARPTSAIRAARDYAAEGNLTRAPSLDPEAALPGRITENLGERSAAGLARAAQGETRVLDRMLDTNKVDAMAQNEQGAISPEQIAYGALLGNAMAITKARFAVSLFKSVFGKSPVPINPKVAENIAEMLYSMDPAQTAKAMAALEKVGLTDRAVKVLMQEAIPTNVAVGAMAGGEGAPDAPRVIQEPDPYAEPALLDTDPSVAGDPAAEADPAMEAAPEGEMPPEGFSDAGQVVEYLFPGIEVTQVERDPNSPLGRANPDSYHNKGSNAVDVRPIPGMTFEEYVQAIQDAGFEIVEALDEVNNPSRHATGPHWHVVFAS